MAFITASPMTETVGGNLQWMKNQDAPLRGDSHDTNGKILEYHNVGESRFVFSAIGSDGITYHAKVFYLSSRSIVDMDSENNFFSCSPNLDLKVTLAIGGIAIGLIFLSGILIAKYVTF